MKRIKREPWESSNAQIVAGLRRIWLRSPERAFVLKAEHYTCEECNAKQSKAKGKEVSVQVHHLDGIDWAYLIAEIRRVLLVHPDRLQVLCKPCHAKENGGK
jgi:hypothetical protein